MIWRSGFPKCAPEPQTSFDAQTVIADFLGDICDGHPRLGPLNPANYTRLRELADILISDLKESGLAVSRPDRETS